MDRERKVNICEGVPLNKSTGAANIFVNTNKNAKSNTPDGTVIHLNTEKPADVGVHINTTLSIASSKKIKLLFILNFLLSIICMVISCTVAFYYANEMISMRRQMDLIKDHCLIQNIKDNFNDKIEQSPLVTQLRPGFKGLTRESRMDSSKEEVSPSARKYYVENLGEDMLLVDSKKKNQIIDTISALDKKLKQRDFLVVHFIGGRNEVHLGNEAIVGPWVKDVEVSTENSDSRIDLVDDKYVAIKETGVYLVYAQVTYISHAPNCYFIWARQKAEKPRLLSTCASASVSASTPLDKSQVTCSVQTVARLNKGDTINIAQREQNRTLWLKSGYTHLGFVKLSS